MQVSERTIPIFRNILLVATFACVCGVPRLYAQVPTPPDTTQSGASGRGGNNVTITGGSVVGTPADTLPPTKDNVPVFKPQPKPDFKYHSPKKATWMSAALPSLGQFYNRRYWKPPIIYVGLGVAIYFLVDNQLKFITARNSYRARVGIPGFTVNSKYTSYDAEQIQSDRDYYRTNRDYCIIAVAAVYALNVIDAAVDAHLRTFDVGDDLSMKVKPSFQMNPGYQTGYAGLIPTPGIAWTLRF